MAQLRTERGPYVKGVERRRRIVEIAVEVFGELGFQGGTLQAVAARAGGTPASVLKLFGSKEALLIAVLEHWDVATEAAMGEQGHGTALLRAFRRLMAYHERHPGLLQLYITTAADSASPTHPAHRFMRQRYDDTLARMRRMLTEASGSGELRALSPDERDHEAVMLLATMDGLELQYLVDRSLRLEQAFAAYVADLERRLRPR